MTKHQELIYTDGIYKTAGDWFIFMCLRGGEMLKYRVTPNTYDRFDFKISTRRSQGAVAVEFERTVINKQSIVYQINEGWKPLYREFQSFIQPFVGYSGPVTLWCTLKPLPPREKK